MESNEGTGTFSLYFVYILVIEFLVHGIVVICLLHDVISIEDVGLGLFIFVSPAIYIWIVPGTFDTCLLNQRMNEQIHWQRVVVLGGAGRLPLK